MDRTGVTQYFHYSGFYPFLYLVLTETPNDAVWIFENIMNQRIRLPLMDTAGRRMIHDRKDIKHKHYVIINSQNNKKRVWKKFTNTKMKYKYANNDFFFEFLSSMLQIEMQIN